MMSMALGKRINAKGHGPWWCDFALKRAEQEKEWAWDNAHEIYAERDLLVCALSKVWPSHLMWHTAARGSDRKPRLAVCIHSPVGKLTWAILDYMRDAYGHLELRPNDWDGAKTAEKRARIAQLTKLWVAHSDPQSPK